MTDLLHAIFEYGVEFVLLVGIMVGGIFLGKFFRNIKDTKDTNKENR